MKVKRQEGVLVSLAGLGLTERTELGTAGGGVVQAVVVSLEDGVVVEVDAVVVVVVVVVVVGVGVVVVVVAAVVVVEDDAAECVTAQKVKLRRLKDARNLQYSNNLMSGFLRLLMS